VSNQQITAWDAFFISGTNRESLDFGITGQFAPAFETNRGLASARITEPLLDEIRFAAIPEPSSLALLGLASLGLASLWRRGRGRRQTA
jgi:hypothetical protein